MELANYLVAIGGDRGHTAPKYASTPAEAAVLMRIHGDDAVFDIKIIGADTRTSRTERERLMHTYMGSINPETRKPIVEELFPGIGVKLVDTFADLGLGADAFKDPPASAGDDDVEDMAEPQPVEAPKPKRGRPAKVETPEPAVAAEPEPAKADDEDGDLFS
jgi:hypothetical protein